LHRELDGGIAQGLDLGCMYVDAGRLADAGARRHPVWTHGSLAHRVLSGVTRAELVRQGFAVMGRPPSALLPDMTDDDVRSAARAELCGYWAWASHRTGWPPRLANLHLHVSQARPRLSDGRGSGCAWPGVCR
jgi:hypothetical protein